MQNLQLKAFRRPKNPKVVMQKMINPGVNQRKRKVKKKRNPKKKRNTGRKAILMTALLQRRARAEKEGMIMVKMISTNTVRLLNTREKEKLITINLKRNLNTRGTTLPQKANHLIKMRNILEGVMIHLM